jgi:hypothetical protein
MVGPQRHQRALGDLLIGKIALIADDDTDNCGNCADK